MTIRGRLERLEATIGRLRPCSECGASREGPIEVAFSDDENPYHGPDRCPRCGRVLHMTFTIDRPEVQEDADDEP